MGVGRELDMFYILIFQWVCWQILFAFWSEHVFRPGVYNSAVYQILVERERKTDSLSLCLSLSHTHTYTERQAHREKEMEWLLKAAKGSSEIGTAWKASVAGGVGKKSRRSKMSLCRKPGCSLQTQNLHSLPCPDPSLGSQRQQQQPEPAGEQAIQGSCLAEPETPIII